jgi:hypothetical protein
MSHPIVHAEIRSSDPDATRAFFGDLFGWTYPTEGALPGYTFVETGVPGAPSGSNTVLNNWNYQDIPFNLRIMSDTGRMPATIPVIDGSTVQNVAPPAGAIAYKTTFVPNFVEFNHSTNILIQGVKFTGPLFWMVHPLSSRNILIRDTVVFDTAHLTDDASIRNRASTCWNAQCHRVDDGTAMCRVEISTAESLAIRVSI